MELNRFIEFYRGKIDNLTVIDRRTGCKAWRGVSGRERERGVVL